jgi:3-methyladenine DNA glycosylase AlkD
MTAALPLVPAVRERLERARKPRLAPAMQAYMKSSMPYWGVKSEPRRAIQREVFREFPLKNAKDWSRAVRELWNGATHREERYVAIELLLAKTYRKHLVLERLPQVEQMITDGAWWDYVDPLAADGIGHLLAENETEMSRTLRKWSKSSDLWKRRSSIIAQLRFKKDTDLRLLYDCIEPNLERPEFFLRKAIGWALRQYAWTDPKEIARYVKKERRRLSPLSQREALKNV